MARNIGIVFCVLVFIFMFGCTSIDNMPKEKAPPMVTGDIVKPHSSYIEWQKRQGLDDG